VFVYCAFREETLSILPV